MKYLVKHEDIRDFDEWIIEDEDELGLRRGTLNQQSGDTFTFELDDSSDLRVYHEGRLIGEVRGGVIWDVLTFLLLTNQNSPLLGTTHFITGEVKRLY